MTPRVIDTTDQLDALPVGSTVRFRTACAAAIRGPHGWQATGFGARDMPAEQVRSGLIGTMPVWVLDEPGAGSVIDYQFGQTA